MNVDICIPGYAAFLVDSGTAGISLLIAIGSTRAEELTRRRKDLYNWNTRPHECTSSRANGSGVDADAELTYVPTLD